MRVLLFDVFGTLVDWRSSMIELAATAAGRAGPRADWVGIIDNWRRAYQPALDRVTQGAAWRDLDSLQRETLSRVLAERGVSLPATARESLVRGWRQLRAWPDSREGLDRLRRTYVTATLSNGHVALLADLLDCRPQDAGMVAAHPSDLRAAAAVGLRPIFVRRPLEWGPGAPAADPPALDGLLETDGLGHLADALGC